MLAPFRPALVLALAVVAVLMPSSPAGSAQADAASGRPLSSHVRHGAYVAGMVADPRRLAAYEAQLGSRVQVASYFYGFGDEFPAAVERSFADGGRRDVLLSWDMGPTRFADWSSGKHDDYLLRIAAHARSYPYAVYVRPWPEMNGDWQDFQPTAGGNKRYGGTPAEFIAAWRHVVTTVRRHGGTNVKWVFNPTADTYAETTDVRRIWPGARYVDVLGLDGYNWGTGGQFRWRDFASIFGEQYRRLTSLHPTAPVWICEYGSKEPLVDDGAPVDPTQKKSRWLTSMLNSQAFPRVTTLVAFEEDKERDWRVRSSWGAVEVMRRAMALSPA